MQKHSLFTLTLVPDCGTESKSGNIDLRFIASGFCLILVLFFACLFYIVGYHIKVYQEKGYKAALSIMEQNLKTIEQSTSQVKTLTEKVTKLQQLDQSFRQYASMPVPDADIYIAGVGGHVIVDDTKYAGISRSLAGKVHDLLLAVNSLDRKTYLEQTSLETISASVERQNDILRNTPDILPTQTLKISSTFGWRINPVTKKKEFHDAVDFNGVLGDKIWATADGVVINAEYHATRGNYVAVQHKYGYVTYYCHLTKIMVTVGQVVKRHDVVGTMGRTGRATGVNLHYSITQNGIMLNPINYF